MRWLLLLFQWSLLFFFLLVGADYIGDCNWEMPKSPVRSPGDPIPGSVTTCTQEIKWKAHNEKEAIATCLEYFPTTYMTVKFTADTITCTVSQHFQCNFLDESLTGGVKAVPMFDKCYTFHPKEITIGTYLQDTNHATYCKKAKFGNDGDKGSLPVFYTMTQAKHIAKEAHRKGIFKIWVNVDKDGKTIEKSGTNAPGFLLYKDQWKLHKNHYWEGDELKATTKTNNEPNFPDEAKYLFFRAKTDYWHNLIQGSFERATENSKAGIVCEYQAKIVPDQERYCDKMGANGLGLNAKYDNSKGQRCVYTTLSRYPLMGTKEAVANFKGCGEKPSEDHSSGLDDAMGESYTYSTLTKDGTYRFAAIKVSTKVDASITKSQYWVRKELENCKPTEFENDYREPYDVLDHFGRSNFVTKSLGGYPSWEDNYPKDECTDFPKEEAMYSNTLAIKKGKIIDVPTPVLFPVICSIASNMDCEIQKFGSNKNDLCPRKDQFCRNVMEWQPATKHYAVCECALYHKEEDKVCKWDSKKTTDDGRIVCGNVQSCKYKEEEWFDIGVSAENMDFPSKFNEYVCELVVRNGCKVTMWSNPKSSGSANLALTGPVEVGEYHVPNYWAATLRGWAEPMSASSHTCECTDPK